MMRKHKMVPLTDASQAPEGIGKLGAREFWDTHEVTGIVPRPATTRALIHCLTAWRPLRRIRAEDVDHGSGVAC